MNVRREWRNLAGPSLDGWARSGRRPGVMRNGELSFEHAGTPRVTLLIHTRTGTLKAERGDWIIRDADGSISCSPVMFEETYERLGPLEQTEFMSKLRLILAKNQRGQKMTH
jgi:hypothetical protein